MRYQDYFYLNPNQSRKESFLNFPNIPNKPAMVYVSKEDCWKSCKTIKQTDKNYISVMLNDGTIYEVPKLRKDFVVPLLDYNDIVEVCSKCRYRRRVSWHWLGTCNLNTECMYRAFYKKYENLELVQCECYERKPLRWYQLIHDKRHERPTEETILKWKKWDRYLF